MEVYLAIPRAGPGLPKPDAENLGPSPARPSGLTIRPKPDPSVKKPIGSRATGRASSLNCKYDRPEPGHRAQNLGPGPARGQGRVGLFRAGSGRAVRAGLPMARYNLEVPNLHRTKFSNFLALSHKNHARILAISTKHHLLFTLNFSTITLKILKIKINLKWQ